MRAESSGRPTEQCPIKLVPVGEGFDAVEDLLGADDAREDVERGVRRVVEDRLADAEGLADARTGSGAGGRRAPARRGARRPRGSRSRAARSGRAAPSRARTNARSGTHTPRPGRSSTAGSRSTRQPLSRRSNAVTNAASSSGSDGAAASFAIVTARAARAKTERAAVGAPAHLGLDRPRRRTPRSPAAPVPAGARSACRPGTG